MRPSKKRQLDIPAPQRISNQDAVAEPKRRRKRRPLPVIRTARPGTLDLTSQKIDQILFG